MKREELVGRLLGGRYRVRGLLGAGGMGAVYEAVQEDLARRVALKVLLDSTRITDEDLRRFRREALAASQLGHPNIVQVTDFQARPGEPPFLVMERLDGESLNDLLKRERPLAPARAVFIATQILAALAAAHAAGIVHRDIKPPNVFLTRTQAMADLAKVLDFGIAKAPSLAGSFRTLPDTILGTPAYMAPEQAGGAQVDHRADIYAVGACLFEMLSGRRPYAGASAGEIIAQLSTTSPPPLLSLRPDLDPALAAVVDRALSRSPAARFASATAMLDALTPWSRADGARPPAASAPADAAPTVQVPPPTAAGVVTAAPTGSTALGVVIGLVTGAVTVLVVIAAGIWIFLASAKTRAASPIASPVVADDFWMWSASPVVADDVVGDATEDVVGVVMFLHRTSERERLAVFDGATLKRVWTAPPFPDNGQRKVFAAAAKRVAIARGRTIHVYAVPSSAQEKEVEFSAPVRQLCRPTGSARELWVELADGESVLFDVVSSARRAAHDPPAGCWPANASSDIPTWNGSRAPEVHLQVEERRMRLLLDGAIGVGNADDDPGRLVGVETTTRPEGSVFVTREVWTSIDELEVEVLEVQDGRAYVRRSTVLVCLDARTGKEIWRAPLGVGVPNRSITISTRAYVDVGGKLLVLDPNSGKRLAEIGYR
ncbi:MAG: protein kinase [Labilithrix sp.]|nr:protein kinase [Labilithrix sp.]MCW5810621.1 protein kinase [Labilithrix sp.]